VDTICGRGWLQKLKINTFQLNSIAGVTSSSSMAEISKVLAVLLLKYGDLFLECVGQVPDWQTDMNERLPCELPKKILEVGDPVQFRVYADIKWRFGTIS
jgi:hypothetical protein